MRASGLARAPQPIAVSAWALLASCAPSVAPPIAVPVERAEPTSLEEALPEDPPSPPSDTNRGRETTIFIAPGEHCVISWEAGIFREDETTTWIGAISRIATLDRGRCRAAVLYDHEAGIGRGCDGAHDPEACQSDPPFDFDDVLAGGGFPESGATFEDHPGILVADMSFDGYADLCVEAMMGAYNYSQICWLFHPDEGVFRRYERLDPIIWMQIDPDAKELRHGLRLGGPAYMSQVLVWEEGELVVRDRIVTVLGEMPDGSPLPPGFDSHQTIERRIGDSLVVVKSGPAKMP